MCLHNSIRVTLNWTKTSFTIKFCTFFEKPVLAYYFGQLYVILQTPKNRDAC